MTVRAEYLREPEWSITTKWAPGPMRPEIVELTFTAPPGELTPAKIKALPLSVLLGEHRWHSSSAALALSNPGPDLDSLITGPKRKGAQRGREFSQSHLAEIASVYRQAVRDGRPVTAAVAEHFEITESTAKKWNMAARAAGLIPPRHGNSSPSNPS